MTMTATLERRCTNSPVGAYRASSMTKANTSYNIVIDARGKHTCTCMAFVMNKNRAGGNSAIGRVTCKHLDAFLATHVGCGWTSQLDEPAPFETVCPRCMDDTELFDPRNFEDIDLDELLESFKIIQRRLNA